MVQPVQRRWVAMLMVMDNRPFPDLRHIVRDVADERIEVYSEWISARHPPKTPDGKQWTTNYHAKLYNLTDEAIRECPPETRWVVVTNGDNDYDPQFMTVLAQQQDAEAVAFDYYSRYQRPTGTPCERFTAGPGLPSCKTNEMKWCQTDLAANAYSWPRFMKDDMRFGILETGRGANHDGIMADLVRTRGWKVAYIRNKCLVDHAPSPQTCAMLGGVWDDTAAASDEGAGGNCLAPGRARQRLEQLGTAAEMIDVEVSHDTASFGMTDEVLKLKCMRLAAPESWKAMSLYYPPHCRAAVDAAQAPSTMATQPAAVQSS
eukprot:GHUV01040967.1.p1 GENE.GHUV01040967.1~~GHUV01040967.1.p1  ORF type:complete len:318 (+),score=72.11 GHUV01040967.1:2345-3298(+)